MTARRAGALIVGGGPAGAVAAIRLARGGIQAELIERRAGPHDMVCGGFLGWDALAALARLGIDTAPLGTRPIHRLRLVSGNRAVEARLPRPAAGLSRRALDAALLSAAEAAGASVFRGVAARAGDEARAVRLDTGEELLADILILATGKYELRGLARSVPERRGEGAVGLRTAFAPAPATAAALEGVIELHPFDGGYAGLLLQEDGAVNLCLSVAAARLREAGGIALLLATLASEAPRLGDRIAQAAGSQWLSVSNVPYGWRADATADGLFRVGDQAAVIASLAGDGIAMALASGAGAADAILAGTAAPMFQSAYARRVRRPVGIAQALRWAAERTLPRRMLLGAARLPGAAGLAARLTRVGSGV